MSTGTVSFQLLDVAELKPSPTNPRKRLGSLDDLVESIRSQGILQPIVARARAKGYEIVCGHRRTEAARVAGLAKIPAVVRDLSDDQVLEAQLVENLERADMHPLEEAEAIQAMLERPGWTQQRVAEKIGRSVVFVAQRVQLLTLSTKCKKALDDGKISVGVALELARVANPKTQDEALEAVRGWNEQGVPTVEHARKVIHDRFRLQLGKATFDTTDANLVPAAGACSTCPKRTGNQASLFADIKSPDLCTDPVCFRGKLDAAFKARSAVAKKEGLKVITKAEEAKAVVRGWSKEWVSLDRKEYVGNTTKTVRQIVGKEVAPAAVTQDPDSGQIVELVPKAVVEKAMRVTRKAEPGLKIRKSSEVEAEKQRRLEEKIELQALDKAAFHIRGGSGVPADVAVEAAALAFTLGDNYFATDGLEDFYCDKGQDLGRKALQLSHGQRPLFVAEWALRSLWADATAKGEEAFARITKRLGLDWKGLVAEARKELVPAPKEPKAAKAKTKAKRRGAA